MSFICVICSENLSSDTNGHSNGSRSKENAQIVATLCGHLFHECCLLQKLFGDKTETSPEWEGIWAKCPTCATPVEVNYLINMYPEIKKADDGILNQSMKLKIIQEIDMTISDMGHLLNRNARSINKMEDLLSTQSAMVKEEIKNMNKSEDCKPKASPSPSLRPLPCPPRGRSGTFLGQSNPFIGTPGSSIRKFQTSAHYSKNKFQLQCNTVTNEGSKRSQSNDEHETGVTFGDFSGTQFTKIHQNENKSQRWLKKQLDQRLIEPADHSSDWNPGMGTNVSDGFPGSSLQPSIILCPHCNGMISAWPCQTK